MSTPRTAEIIRNTNETKIHVAIDLDGTGRQNLSTGVPFLKDLPLLGYLFQVESESTRKSQMVLVAECEYLLPDSAMPVETAEQLKKIDIATADAGEKNLHFYRQHGLDR